MSAIFLIGVTVETLLIALTVIVTLIIQLWMILVNDSWVILILIKISAPLIALIIILPVILTILPVMIMGNNDNNNNNKVNDKISDYNNKGSSRNDYKHKKNTIMQIKQYW